jgi:phenylacetate-CoA ligase
MPLIRYDIGDFAEVGPPCGCGRTLPVVTRIMGRARHMLTTPDGARYWPFFGTTRFGDIGPIRQYQFAQVAPDAIEARLVVDRPLTPDEEDALRRRILSRLPWPFRIDLVRRERIDRGPGDKYEDFRSEMGRALSAASPSA